MIIVVLAFIFAALYIGFTFMWSIKVYLMLLQDIIFVIVVVVVIAVVDVVIVVRVHVVTVDPGNLPLKFGQIRSSTAKILMMLSSWWWWWK